MGKKKQNIERVIVLNSMDVSLINRMLRPLGEYINPKDETFNAKIGPKTPMVIFYYDSRTHGTGESKKIILRPDYAFVPKFVEVNR